ncbi:MAG TPA: methyltransferase domain-containing protein [Methylophaga aminisulfidivorans]|uniref:Methyltransferase domain-containing protein n=2 Tax=root TaxID=1 RepID=A0A7C2A843_9GAMM|nr:methyltransferase domain-containing protein [Methylophaga aminisulfidivorans]
MAISHSFCPLCQHQSPLFYDFKQRRYYQCGFCSAVFMDRNLWPDIQAEKTRYLEHLNEVSDLRFQHFVSPITNAVQNDYNFSHKGLDFGAGHAPVITHVLTQAGYQIEAYDPLFINTEECLNQQYDYVTSCEVIEHFHQPAKSFALLKHLLKPSARLYCMTELFHEGIDFHQWNYKNDPTHVFMYHRNTISYISERYGFLKSDINGRLVTFTQTQ